MKAVIITNPGGPEVLRVEDRPAPEPLADEVRIRVSAAGINRPDIIQRQGSYPAPDGVPQDIPGLEVAGIVDKAGSDVKRWKEGDHVCALLAGGGYAEYVTVSGLQCLPVPEGWSFTEAASVPETFFTVWTNIFQRGKFQSGEKVLIHGGSSGIGVAGIQIVTALGGQVVVTAGSDEKCRACESLGAMRAINYKEEDFEKIIRDDFGGVNIILDMVGGDYTARNLQSLVEDGRLIMINAMRGRNASVDLMRVMVKRLTITGSTLRVRDADFKHTIAIELEQNVWPLLASGKIKPVIFKTFPLEKAHEAHALMEDGNHIGKIILEVQ